MVINFRFIEIPHPPRHWFLRLDGLASFQIARRHSGQVNILFVDGLGLETLRQLLYPSVENWIRFNYDKSATLR